MKFKSSWTYLFIILTWLYLNYGLRNRFNMVHPVKKIEQQVPKVHFINQDSILLENALKEALKMAKHHVNDAEFDTNYSWMPDSLPLDIDISMGEFFTKEYSHLIVRRSEPGMIMIDIYQIENGSFRRVGFHEEGTITYLNDTIFDVNGDGTKDFVVNSYGASGCCLKGFSQVFIIQKDKTSPLEGLEFINATFAPDEKMVRGICYGFAGETEMYKFRWRGDLIDTVEYISIERDSAHKKTGWILVTDKRQHLDGVRTLRKLKYVPQEYKKIKDYSWFSGD